MKFKAGKTYDALFLSDIHYLLNKKVKEHGHRELFQFLDHLHKRRVRFRAIYLVGDIIESWYFNAGRQFKKKKKRFHRLFDRFDNVAAPGAEKYYIIGNHDTTSFTMDLDADIRRYLETRLWHVTEKVETEDMVILHGHQGQYTRLTWMFDILIVRLCFSLAYLFPELWRVAENFYHSHLNGRDPRTPEQAIQYYGRLSHVSGQGDRILVSGHTHGFLCIPELKVINTGDWLHNRTFVIRNKDRMIGGRVLKKKSYKTEFEFKLYKSGKKNKLKLEVEQAQENPFFMPGHVPFKKKRKDRQDKSRKKEKKAKQEREP